MKSVRFSEQYCNLFSRKTQKMVPMHVSITLQSLWCFALGKCDLFLIIAYLVYACTWHFSAMYRHFYTYHKAEGILLTIRALIIVANGDKWSQLEQLFVLRP